MTKHLLYSLDFHTKVHRPDHVIFKAISLQIPDMHYLLNVLLCLPFCQKSHVYSGRLRLMHAIY